MKILIITLFMLSFADLVHSEVCLKNSTQYTGDHFAFGFIASPVVDRESHKVPVLTSPKQVAYTQLGDQDEVCLEYSDSINGNYGHLAVFINSKASRNDWFWMSVEPLVVSVNETLEIVFSQGKNGGVHVISHRGDDSGASWQIRIPYERVINEKQ